jgi:hypothetical protein
MNVYDGRPRRLLKVVAGMASILTPEYVVRRFAALQTSIPSVDAFESGENCSPEGLHQEHTHAFVPTFSSG